MRCNEGQMGLRLILDVGGLGENHHVREEADTSDSVGHFGSDRSLLGLGEGASSTVCCCHVSNLWAILYFVQVAQLIFWLICWASSTGFGC